MLGFPSGIAVEPSGDVVVTDLVLDAVVHVDTATGDRMIVSDAATGTGPPLTRAMAIDAALDPTFCVFVCPSELCGICLLPAPSLVSVDPASGDRTRVSGGGSCVVVSVSSCLTPFFGRRGGGPDFFEMTGVAVESPRSYLVADGDGTVMRVNSVTGRRRVLADLGGAPTAARTRLRRLESPSDGPQVYRPREPEVWLRSALGSSVWARALRHSPETFLASLSPVERRAVGDRLYAALWQTMWASDKIR